MSDEWTEVNLVPPSEDDRIKVLLDVIDPLVHDKLRGRLDSWHYGQYSDPAPFHLRLRIHWQQSEQVAEDKAELFDFLDTKKLEGILVDRYEGSHGERGLTYPGEADEYGTEMWDITYKFWESQSEYALTLMKHEFDNSLSKQVPFHWERSAHLLTNRLFLNYFDEAYLSLNQARGYLDIITGHTGNSAVITLTQIQREIGRQLRQFFAKSVARKFDQDFNQR